MVRTISATKFVYSMSYITGTNYLVTAQVDSYLGYNIALYDYTNGNFINYLSSHPTSSVYFKVIHVKGTNYVISAGKNYI